MDSSVQCRETPSHNTTQCHISTESSPKFSFLRISSCTPPPAHLEPNPLCTATDAYHLLPPCVQRSKTWSYLPDARTPTI